MRILMTGATGFLGSEIAAAWLSENSAKSNRVRILSRDAGSGKERLGAKLVERGVPPARARAIEAFAWDPESGAPSRESLEGVDAVIHLAGENIAGGKWTAERKRRIRDSRVLGTRHLARAIAELQEPPVFLSASAIGFYGDRGSEVLTEESTKGAGFLSDVCEAWEAEAMGAGDARTVVFRNGVALGQGGALEKILPLFKAGVGGRIGDGKQWMSWIGTQDLVGLYLAAIPDSRYSGVVNAVAPGPVTNREFTETLASVLHRPHAVPVPAFALKLALGEMAEETLLASQRVAPARAEALGYAFREPALRGALETLLEA